MDANQLIARIGELQEAVEKSAAYHNGLVGRLMEARETLERMANPSQMSSEQELDAVENSVVAEVISAVEHQ